MLNQQQILEHYQQLLTRYPQVNTQKQCLFYGSITVKGALDEWKELLPWGIALSIFTPIAYCLHYLIQHYIPTFDNFLSYASSMMLISLFLMLIAPLIIYQIHHSSAQLYNSIKNIPFKITLIILLQAINLKFLHSSLLLSALFFCTLRYGFILFLKENLFKAHIANSQIKYLRHARQLCFLSYLRILSLSLKMKFKTKSSARYQQLSVEKNQWMSINADFKKFEDKLYQNLKYIDLESYIDELTK